MALIFISYRREDTTALTGRIYDRLRASFGPGSVLLDVDSIPLAVDFRRHISETLMGCQVLLAVIGGRWLLGENGRRRLTEPGDFVRMEVETALARGIPVIPILAGETNMPTPEDLPEPLQSLSFHNALRVDPGRDFHHHIDRLLDALETLVTRPQLVLDPEPPAKPYRSIGQPHPVLHPMLQIVSGPSKGVRYPLTKDRILVGRRRDCDIYLEGRMLSQYHAQFARTSEGYALEDLRSANGCYINGERVNERKLLNVGDRIHLGDVILVYLDGEGEPIA